MIYKIKLIILYMFYLLITIPIFKNKEILVKVINITE